MRRIDLSYSRNILPYLSYFVNELLRLDKKRIINNNNLQISNKIIGYIFVIRQKNNKKQREKGEFSRFEGDASEQCGIDKIKRGCGEIFVY